MKRFLKSLCVALSLALAFGLCSCDDKYEYTMKSYTTGALSYEIPEHFEPTSHSEADAYYLTLNSAVTVYSYTLPEFDLAFRDYVGDYSARSVAEFLVDMHEYNCAVNDGTVEGSAVYSYMYSDDNVTGYSTGVVLANADNIAVFLYSCNADKLDLYQEMILEILGSLELRTNGG